MVSKCAQLLSEEATDAIYFNTISKICCVVFCFDYYYYYHYFGENKITV